MYGDPAQPVDSGVWRGWTLLWGLFCLFCSKSPGDSRVRITDAYSLLKPFEESGESSAEDGGGGGAR